MSEGGETTRVLHVDDEPDFAEMVAMYLEREDERLEVQAVQNPVAALEAMTEDIDCLVSDYEMAELTGLELLSAVREQYPKLPFILYTGRGSESVASEAISAGVTDYLQKQSGPQQYELLANRIETAVGQYRAERKLERQSDLFGKVQNIADVGAWEYDPLTETCHYSQQVYDIYAIDPATDCSPMDDIMAFYRSPDRETIREAFQTAIDDGEEYDLELQIVAGDGTEKWVRVRGEPQFEAGQCVRVRGTIRDISDRKRREQKLEAEQAFIEQSLNTLDDIFYALDTEGNLERWNSTLSAVTGYTDREIASMSAFDFFEPEYQSKTKESVQTTLETGSHVSESELLTADGRCIPHEFRSVLMTDEDENPIRVIGIGRDISERKQRERELVRQNERLDEFVSIVSHDLRSPLNVAMTGFQLITEECECDPEQLEYVQGAHERMATLLEDLLTLAREGKSVTDPTPVAVGPLVESCWDTVETAEATLDIDGSERLIVADPSRLKQLIENLLRNAVEHGGESVSISISVLEDGFAFEDDGPGIPVDDRQTVFEAGYSNSPGGTGFGLSIVREIVDAHEWEIMITEGSTGGARFEITGVELHDS